MAHFSDAALDELLKKFRVKGEVRDAERLAFDSLEELIDDLKAARAAGANGTPGPGLPSRDGFNQAFIAAARKHKIPQAAYALFIPDGADENHVVIFCGGDPQGSASLQSLIDMAQQHKALIDGIEKASKEAEANGHQRG